MSAPRLISLGPDCLRLRREFSENRLVVIDEFLEEGFAAELHRALQTLNDRFWYRYRATRKQRAAFDERQAIGRYRMYPLTKHQESPLCRRKLAFRPVVKELGATHPFVRLAAMLNSRAMQNLLEDLSSIPLTKRSCICFASRYENGDFLASHTDGSFPRRLAFVLYMTKGWKRSWGGNFFAAGRGAPIVPGFNSLLLFEVPARHRVSPVSVRAAYGRDAISGWFHDYSKTHFASHAKKTGEIPSMIKRMVFT